MPDALIPVPSLAELAVRGLADVLERNKKGEPTIYAIKPQGFDTMYSAMKHNATLLKNNEALRRQRETAAIQNAKMNGGKK